MKGQPAPIAVEIDRIEGFWGSIVELISWQQGQGDYELIAGFFYSNILAMEELILLFDIGKSNPGRLHDPFGFLV